MKINMGNFDRIVRLIVASTLIGLYASNIITGVSGVIVLLLAIVLILTSLISICPLYSALGISTRKKIKSKY